MPQSSDEATLSCKLSAHLPHLIFMYSSYVGTSYVLLRLRWERFHVCAITFRLWQGNNGSFRVSIIITVLCLLCSDVDLAWAYNRLHDNDGLGTMALNGKNENENYAEAISLIFPRGNNEWLCFLRMLLDVHEEHCKLKPVVPVDCSTFIKSKRISGDTSQRRSDLGLGYTVWFK